MSVFEEIINIIKEAAGPDYDTIRVDKAEELINLYAEQYRGGWRSVDEELPTKEGSYLVVGKTGGATVTRWYGPSEFHPQGHFGGNSAEYIRWWMPRPTAPKEKRPDNTMRKSSKSVDVDTVDSLIKFQNEFIKRYVARFNEEPTVDMLIRDALVELKDLKGRQGDERVQRL